MEVDTFFGTQMEETAVEEKKIAIFEKMPVWKAVTALALPAILSQLVTMIYNLADTFYIGQLGDPNMVAGVSLSFPAFMILTAFGNLFGIGGGSLISRKLGEKRTEDARRVASFSLFGALFFTLIYIVFLQFFTDPILRFLGASDATIGYGRDYLYWTAIAGGVPTIVAMLMGHLLRSEGFARQSSVGIAVGGILNILLDPLFIFGFHMDVAGAAMATAISNLASAFFYVIVILRLGNRTHVSLDPTKALVNRDLVRQVFSVGLPAAAASLFANLANSCLNIVLSWNGDLAIAAMGVVKRIDMIPLNVALGLSQGALPLIAYNYAAKQYDRMEGLSRFARAAGAGFAILCVVFFELFAPDLVYFFIKDQATVEVGAGFLRVACLGTIPMVMFFLLNTTFQAMGEGKQSFFLVFCRQILFNLPILFSFNFLFGTLGAVWTQPVADVLAVILATVFFTATMRRLRREEAAAAAQAV